MTVLGATPKIDTTDFQNGIKNMNSALRALETSFRTSAAGMGDWENNASGLELRSKSLSGQIEIQKQKVEVLRKAYEESIKVNGENSTKTLDAMTAYNRAGESLNKMEAELTQTNTALTEMNSVTEESGSGWDTLKSKVDSAAVTVGTTAKNALSAFAGAAQIAAQAIIALGAAVAAAIAGVFAFTLKMSETAGNLADMSAQTGISTDSLQEMAYVGSQIGVSLDTITSANTKLIKSMFSAKDGTGAQADAFKTLGVSVTDASGNLRDNQAVFDDVITALGGVENPAERDALAMQLFGKSAQELNPLIKTGADELARLSDEAHKNGAVVNGSVIATLDALGDSVAGLKLSAQGVGMNIAAIFAPFAQGIIGQAQGYLTQLNEIVTGSGGDMGKIAEGIGGLVGQIATDIASQLPQLIQTGVTVIEALLKAIISNLPQLMKSGVSIVMTLINAIAQNAPMLIQAAVDAIITLANGISAALPTLVPVIVQALLTIINTLLQNAPMLIAAALNLMMALAEGLKQAAPLIGEQMPAIIGMLVAVLLASIPIIIQVAGQIIWALAEALAAAVPQSWIKASEGFLANLIIQAVLWVRGVEKAAQDVITAITNKFKGMVEIGKSFVVGIWTGISGNVDWLLGKIGGFAASVVDYVKEALGIASPSKEGIAIGDNFMRSIALGGQRAMYDVGRQMSAMMGEFSAATASGARGGGRTTTQTTNDNSFDIWGNVIINGEVAAGSLGAALTGRRF